MIDHVDDGQLSRLIDDDLSLTCREAVVGHLRECPSCAQRHDQLVEVAAVLRLENAVRWTEEETAAVLDRLPRRRHRGRVAAAGVVSVAVCGVALVEAAPLIASTLALLGVLVGLGGALAPPAVAASGLRLLVMLAVIAVLAPLAAYPLARWR